MRRALRIGAGLGLALVVITCTERSLTGPGHPGSAAFDFSAWAAPTPGTPQVPIDSLEIILQRASDGSIALDRRLGFRPDTLKGDSLVVSVDLQQSPETVTISIRMYGGGMDWYRFTGTVQVTAGVTARPAIAGQYVGTGANATRVVIGPADTTAVGGTTFPLRAIAFDAVGDTIHGVPIGYRLSDSTRGTVVYPTPYTATLTAARSLRDSAWVVAETPTHLKDSTRVHLVPQPAQLIKVAGDNQTGVVGGALGGPLVVRLLDALGAGFKGDSVRWSVSVGSATLSSGSGVTDDTGYAQVIATPTALGPLAVQVIAKAISGAVSGSPATFGALARLGIVKHVVISPKVDTVAYGATVPYTATLTDSLGNVVSAPVIWTSSILPVATVTSSGVATAVGGDSTWIIAASGGVADTARLYVRVLRTITLSPSDTVITAVGDAVQLRTAAFDNFGALVTTGLKIRFSSPSSDVVKIDTTGKATLVAAGSGVVLAVDTLAPGIVVQGAATLRVNQLTFGLINTPKDSVVVGTNGQAQILAAAIDSNGYVIPGKSFSWVTRPLAVTGGPIANITSTGLVTGVAVGNTYAVDTLVEGLKVFRDSTKVVVVSVSAPALHLSNPSLTLGVGQTYAGQYLYVDNPVVAPLVVSLVHTDSLLPSASQAFTLDSTSVTIPANGAASAPFTITGNTIGSVYLIARAPAYSQATGLVQVTQPTLVLALGPSAIVGQPTPFVAYAADLSGAPHAVAAPLSVALTSSPVGGATFSSTTVTIPAGNPSVADTVTFASGVYTVTATATGYAPGSVIVTASGALVTMTAPTTFSPPIVTISAGQSVTWRNGDTINHTSTSDTGIWDSGPMLPGQVYSLLFSTPGTYAYHCAIHGTIMSGTVIVQ